MANKVRTEAPSSSSSNKQRDGRVLYTTTVIRTVLLVAIAVCTVANVWCAATIVDLPQQQQQQQPLHESFAMESNNKKMDSRKGNKSNIQPKHENEAMGGFKTFNSTTTTTTRRYSALPVPVYNCTNHHNQTLTLRHDPHFIIAGVQKGGTSALYALLRRHPNIVPTKGFETHFFDVNSGIPNNNVSALNQQQKCYYRGRYSHNFNVKKLTPQIMTFEKTPNYLGFSEIPKMITDLCFWKPKMIFVLRNPVDRAHSQYRMNVQETPNYVQEFPTFESSIQNSIKILRFHKDPTHTKELAHFNATAWLDLPDSAFSAHDVPNPNRRRTKSNDMLRRGMYAQQLKPWLDEFELGTDLFVTSYEKLVSQKKQVWHDILQFVGAPAMDNMDANTMDKNYSPRHNKQLKKTATTVLPLDNATRAALHRLYRPYNDELADLLGDSWRGVWD